jgi:ABC-type nitrate/sulfonate/bicarbonate transport system substrate-binding protein
MKYFSYLTLFLLILISCAPPADAYLGFQSNKAFEIPIELAYKTDIFSPQELGIKEYSSAEAVLEALFNKKIDLAILPLETVEKNSAEAQLKKLAYYQREGIALASRDSSFTQVAVVKNSLAALMLENLLQREELDFHLRYYPSETALQKAYEQKEITAICHKIPQLFQFDNLTHKIWLSQYFGRYPNSLLVTSQAAYAADSTFFLQKIDQISQAVQIFNQDLPLAKAAASKFAQIKSENLSDFIYQTRFIISFDKNGQKFEKELWSK